MAEKRPRISWASETVNKAFLEACIYEMVHNGREGCGLKRTSWDAISEKLKNDHGYLADRKQVKNRYDYLKFKYQAWAILKNKTGNFYNPITNTFTMSNEEWEKEAKLNKFVDKLRNAPLSFPDLCIQLFDSATSTGSHSWGPSSTVNHPAEVFTEHDFEDIQCSQMETPTPEMEIPASKDPPPASEESSGRSKNKGGKRNGGKEARVNTLDDDLREVGREIVKAAQSFVEKNDIDKDMEGIAHDSRVLKEVAFNPTSGFPFPPPDKYYLCDAAYTNTRGFMAPYRNTRYWLADFRRRRALTKEERFNHAHAQLRNVIERAYGVLKARFPILKQMAPYPFPIQRDIVIACFAVHNFIRKYNIQDDLFTNFEENTTVASDVQGGGSEDQNTQGIEWGSEAVQYMVNLRDQIANQLLLSGSS